MDEPVTPRMIDLTDLTDLEVSIKADGQVAWVNVNGRCRLRAHGINRLVIDDRRGKPMWQTEFTVPQNQSGIDGWVAENQGHSLVLYSPWDTAVPIGDDGCFFVRLHSFDDRALPEHTRFTSLTGRRVRVTVEVLDPGDPEKD